GRGFRDAAEGADQIDLDHAFEAVERVMPDLAGLAVAAGGLEGAPDAGAIDQDAFLPDQAARAREPRIDLSIRGHVDLAEDAADLARDPLAELGIQIEQRHLDAARAKPPRRRGTEAGGAAGHNGRYRAVELHRGLLPFAAF